MSGELRFNAAVALPVAQKVVGDLADLCKEIEIAGSLRRKKPTVGDIELVALPRNPLHFLARLDKWIVTGTARKALYPDGRYRYGEKFRSITLDNSGLKIEIFLADELNWGWQLALRTGSSEANQFVMSQCIHFNSPYRAVGGYWLQADGKRIAVPTEQELFRLWGMGFVPPKARTIDYYQKRMNPPQWANTWTVAQTEDTNEQLTLF